MSPGIRIISVLLVELVLGRFKCRGKQKEWAQCEVEPCETARCTDCVWSEWAPYSACTCSGLKERHRVIAQQSNDCGKPCEGAKVETASCKPDCFKEPQDCLLSGWGDWSQCDKACGGGQRYRSRTIVQNLVNRGKACEGDMIETESCNQEDCEDAVDCVLGEWGMWTACSQTCNSGEQTRSREVDVIGRAGGKPCEGSMIEMRACNRGKCDTDVDCEWHDWQPWSACSKSCGTGTRTRSRMIAKAPRGNGQLCEPVDMIEVDKCNGQSCGATKDCLMSEWSEWDACSCTCHGVQQRSRHIEQYPAKDRKSVV